MKGEFPVEDGLSLWVKLESTPMKAWMLPLPRVFKEEALKHFPQEIVINDIRSNLPILMTLLYTQIA